MPRRLKVVALLVLVTAAPVDAQIASEGTVRVWSATPKAEYCQGSRSPR